MNEYFSSFDILVDPICIINDSENLVYANQSFLDTFGVRRRSVTEKASIWSVVNKPSNLEFEPQKDPAAWSDFSVEVTVECKNHEILPMQIFVTKIPTPDMTAGSLFFCFWKDVSLEIKLSKKYHGKLEENKKLVEELKYKVIETEYLRAISSYSYESSFSEVLHSIGELGKRELGLRFFSAIHEKDINAAIEKAGQQRFGMLRNFLPRFLQLVKENHERSWYACDDIYLVRIDPKFGERFWVFIQGSPERFLENGFIKALQSQICRVAENYSLIHLSITDALTGAFNRRFFDAKIEDCLADYRMRNEPFCLAIIDVDFFKKVNDNYGHPAGDAVLVHLSNLLKGSIRKSDFCARLGGEEFAIILRTISLNDAVAVMEKIRKKVQDSLVTVPVDGKHEQIAFTISCGLVSIEETRLGAEALYEICDERLYAAKHSGRNNVKTAA